MKTKSNYDYSHVFILRYVAVKNNQTKHTMKVNNINDVFPSLCQFHNRYVFTCVCQSELQLAAILSSFTLLAIVISLSAGS